jgi:hypothetical protein
VIYRDETTPKVEKLRRVRAQLAIARARPADDEVNGVQRQRLEIARLRRSVRRLRNPLLRSVPTSLAELGFVLGYGMAVFLMAVCLCAAIASPVAILAARFAEYEPAAYVAPAWSPRWTATIPCVR